MFSTVISSKVKTETFGVMSPKRSIVHPSLPKHYAQAVAVDIL